MSLQIRHYIYNAMKHIVDQHDTRQYRISHNLEVILYLFWLIRGLFISLMYLDSEQFPLYEFDYMSEYFWKNRKIFNKFFMILIILFTLTGLLGIKTFFYSRVDTLSFQVLYDCIVYNTDQYYKSRDTDENIAMKLSQRFENYQQQFARNHRLLSIIIPRFLVNHLFRIRVWIDSWLQLDRVDRNLFENRNKMRLFPNANRQSRTHVLLFVLIIDYCNHIIHIFICKYHVCFCSYFNFSINFINYNKIVGQKHRNGSWTGLIGSLIDQVEFFFRNFIFIIFFSSFSYPIHIS